MSAPAIWVFLPGVVGALTLFPWRPRALIVLGGGLSLLLALAALITPIDVALRIASLSLKIAPSMQILGRSLALPASKAPLLAFIYGMSAVWFFGAGAAGVARRLIPLGLMITALLVASIAVEPFLYAALLIEMAALLAIPLLSPPGQAAGRGVLRFLIYQTLAMPFILLAGWLLAGVEASPGDLALAVQSTTMLGLGFAFLLAIFPLYSWIPLLSEEASPYVVGFLLWTLPLITVVFGLGFLDRYSFLRASPRLAETARLAGLLMVVSGGLWCAFQRHLGRQMAYAAIAETGLVLLALSLDVHTAVQLIVLLFIPRALGLAIWALALTVLRRPAGSPQEAEPLRFAAVKGMARTYPFAAVGMILSFLSSAGFPLLAGFPPRLALWEGVAGQSLGAAAWLGLGLIGLLTGATRSLAVLVMTPENTPWQWRETGMQAALIAIGVIGLFLLGLFPQVAQIFLRDLPAMFEHLQ